MAVQIQFRRGTAAEWASVSPILAVAEMGIETDTNLFKIGDGILTWNNLNYGGVRGYSGSTGVIGYTGSKGLTGFVGSQGVAGEFAALGYTGSAGTIAVNNVLYVSKSGNDGNSGAGLNLSKLTIAAALAVATTGTTVFVKSGDYTENNPVIVPKFISVVGDNLRSVTVRPQNTTQDLFYLNNGCYLANMTFKDHVSPSAAVAFNPNGSAGVISTSPYVQNCSSLTTDGTGMRVNGNHALGTKSMVVDAFTQYNQGGIGIHLLNSGYAQLVSVFTICCDKGFLAESGGNCSITNSNSSFGNYALYADGVSSANYSGKLDGAASGRTFVIDNLNVKPGVGDAVNFGDSTSTYYTILSSTAFKTGNTDIAYPVLTAESATYRNDRQTILDKKSNLQVLTINHILDAFPGFSFNQFKCSRDIGLIIDAVCYDMVLNTNYQTIKAATSYYGPAGLVISAQLTQTLNAVNFLKVRTLALLTVSTSTYTRINALFDILLDIIQNGLNYAPAFAFNSPTGVSTATINASQILQNNKTFIAEETIAYLNTSSVGLVYSTSTCKRDIGFVIDAVSYDVLYGGNSQTADAADSYYDGAVFQIPIDTKPATLSAYAFIKTIIDDCILNNVLSPPQQTVVAQSTTTTAATTVQSNIAQALIDIVYNIIDNAYSSTVTIEESVATTINDNAVVTFHQYSLIASSGHSFEWIGAGTNIDAALPFLGGVPISANQAVEINSGKVYFTGTDQRGDFRIGNDLVINRNLGTISGRTFTKSLFAVMTPYILAIGA